jgi:hypothetical protein
MSSSVRDRLSVNIAEETATRIRRLVASPAVSVAETIRRAISLSHLLAAHAEEGEQVILHSPGEGPLRDITPKP